MTSMDQTNKIDSKIDVPLHWFTFTKVCEAYTNHWLQTVQKIFQLYNPLKLINVGLRGTRSWNIRWQTRRVAECNVLWRSREVQDPVLLVLERTTWHVEFKMSRARTFTVIISFWIVPRNLLKRKRWRFLDASHHYFDYLVSLSTQTKKLDVYLNT